MALDARTRNIEAAAQVPHDMMAGVQEMLGPPAPSLDQDAGDRGQDADVRQRDQRFDERPSLAFLITFNYA